MELTREELSRLLGLAAGLALNQAVAVRVLGWRLNEIVPSCGWPPGTEETHLSVPVPDYSGDVAAAMGLFNRFPRIVLQRAPAPDGTVGCRCSVPAERIDPRRAGQPLAVINGDGPTPELAICRAALAFAASGGAEWN